MTDPNNAYEKEVPRSRYESAGAPDASDAPPPPTPGTAPTDKQAIWSLVLSVLGIVCFCLFLSLPGIIMGHMAYSRIRKSGGALAGEGLALGGIITGYVGAFFGLITLLGFLAGLFIPALATSRHAARTTQSLNNLKQIGLAVALYQADNDETPPPDLKSLDKYVGGRSNTKMFIHPGSGTEAGEWDDIDTWSDYQYVPGPLQDKPEEAIRAYLKPGLQADGGSVVLYQDSHVQRLDEEAFQEALQGLPQVE